MEDKQPVNYTIPFLAVELAGDLAMQLYEELKMKYSKTDDTRLAQN